MSAQANLVALPGDLAEDIEDAVAVAQCKTRLWKRAGYRFRFLEAVLNCEPVEVHFLESLAEALEAIGEDRLVALGRRLQQMLSGSRGQRAAGAGASSLEVPGGRDPNDHRTIDLEDFLAQRGSGGGSRP